MFIFTTIAPFVGDLMANTIKSGSCMCFIVGLFSKPNKTLLFFVMQVFVETLKNCHRRD